MASAPANVLSLFGAPEKNSCLHALSLALLRVRANGLSCAQIGQLLNCTAETVENASNARHMLGFEPIARLLFHFPKETAMVRALWDCGPADDPTPAERLDHALREIELVRKGLA